MADGDDQVRRWRQMAQECRVKAEQMADAGARSSFLYMATTYDSMADRFIRLSATSWLDRIGNPEPPPAAPEPTADTPGQRRR